MKLKLYTGSEVRELRQKLRLNQAEFWAHFHTTQSGGSRYESGRVLTAVDSRTNPASTAGTAQHDLDLVSG